MDMNDDYKLIDDLLLVHGYLGHAAGLPDDVEVAWSRVWSWVSGRLVASPPVGVGAAYDGSVRLVEQLHRTALAGQLPLRNSVGMEQLLLRWVIVAEQMAGLLEAITKPEATARGNGGGDMVADDGYQPDFCDYCGQQLTGKGFCLKCDKDFAFDF